MAHVFDGTWGSIAFKQGDIPVDDGSFSLAENATGGKLEKSKHEANDVSGDITDNGGKPHIHIVDDKASTPAIYEGDILLQVSLPKQKTLSIIVGTRKTITVPVRPHNKLADAFQEEGTWVATKQG